MKLSRWAYVGPVVWVAACAARPDLATGSDVEQRSSALVTAVDTSMCPEGTNIIIGTDGDDVLIGTRGRDCILGLGGNDKIDGRGGDDVLLGGDGDDILIGGGGDDILIGGDGNDQLEGGGGRDHLFGGNGNDLLRGGDDGDFMDGGDGNDVLLGGRGRDTLLGGAGDDVIDDGPGADRVDGGDGVDRCRGENCEIRSVSVRRCRSNDDCPATDRCADAGICIGCLADTECDDHNVCTGDSCQPIEGCQHVAVPDGTSCADQTVCDGTELCEAGACQPGTALHCDDGLFCDGQESCDAVSGCQPGTPPATDDGISCTTDTCNESTRSIDHIPNDAICGPGFSCSPTGCANIDECATGQAVCGANTTCVDDTPSDDGEGDVTPPYQCNCNPGFEHDPNSIDCIPICVPITVGAGVTRCVRVRYNGAWLYLSPDGASPYDFWQGTYTQSDEPANNYCGPTAGMNFLSWYGLPASYTQLGQEMRTNTWDTSAVFGVALTTVCALDPICAGVVTAAVMGSVGQAGSLPSDVGSTFLSSVPAGYTFCGNPPLTLDQIERSIADGNPIVVLVSEGAGNLHWEVIVGIDTTFLPILYIANADGVSPILWSDFQSDWSLTQLGDAAALMNSLFGAAPNLSFRWEKLANLPPPLQIAPATFCP